MTKSEYQKLVEFIAPKFDRFEREFEKIDKRFDGIETRLIKVEVYAEENRHLIQTVAEGVQANSQKLDASKAEVTAEFAAVRSEMAFGFTTARSEMATEFGAVRSEMANEFGVVRSEMAEGFESVKESVQGMHGRVRRLEAYHP